MVNGSTDNLSPIAYLKTRECSLAEIKDLSTRKTGRNQNSRLEVMQQAVNVLT